MNKKFLSVIENPYRATFEELDDAGLWFSAAVKKEGADMSVLLVKGAVNYARAEQNPPTLSIGDMQTDNSPNFSKTISEMVKNGTPVYVCAEDANDYGLEKEALVAGVHKQSRGELARMIAGFDEIWWW